MGRPKLRTEQERKEMEASRKARTYLEARLECLKQYGPNKEIRCSWAGCNENDVDVLDLDHINGGGRQDRKKNNGRSFFRNLIKNNFPFGYQVLCKNHNWKKYILSKRCDIPISHK